MHSAGNTSLTACKTVAWALPTNQLDNDAADNEPLAECSKHSLRSGNQGLTHSLPDGLDVHEVAVSTTVARVLLVLPAGCLPEVRHRGELCIDGAPCVVAACQALNAPCC